MNRIIEYSELNLSQDSNVEVEEEEEEDEDEDEQDDGIGLMLQNMAQKFKIQRFDQHIRKSANYNEIVKIQRGNDKYLTTDGTFQRGDSSGGTLFSRKSPEKSLS